MCQASGRTRLSAKLAGAVVAVIVGSSIAAAAVLPWPMLLSSLKSLVETGEPLEFGRGA